MPMIDIEFPMLPRLPALLCKLLWMLVVFDIKCSEISCDVITYVVVTYQDRYKSFDFIVEEMCYQMSFNGDMYA